MDKPDAVIIATGASVAKWQDWKANNAQRIWRERLRAVCDGFFFRGKDVAVRFVTGITAAEEALYLSSSAVRYTY